MPYVLGLDELANVDERLIGGKAASLGRLFDAGFAVPRGFVLLTEGTSQSAIQGEVRDAVLESYRRLVVDGGNVAVRSSAVGEDSADASFAGQYETVLDIGDEESLLAAVETCVASLDGEAASAYRADASPDTDPAMAVIVQLMVPAEVAGVAFGIDPATGEELVVVEAVAGLGESLVSGAAEADRIVLDATGREVIDRHHPNEAVLTSELAREVAAQTLRAGEEFGTPQDIEFAFGEGRLWLLQSRPITVAGDDGTDGWTNEFDTPTTGEDEWTGANVQEVLPGLLKPFTISLFAHHAHDSYTAVYRQQRLLDDDEWPDSFGFFYNRAFLHLGTLREVTNRTFSGQPDVLEHRFFGGEAERSKIQHSRRLWKFRAQSLVPLVRMAFDLHKKADRAERATTTVIERNAALDPASMTDAALGRRITALFRFGSRVFHAHVGSSSAAALGFETISQLIAPVLGDETEAKLPVLFSGMQNVESAAIGLDLWHLSRVAREQGVAGELSAAGFDPYAPGLPGAWTVALTSFMDRHGHRGMNEVDPSVHPWRSDPAPVIRSVAAYLDVPDGEGPQASLDRQEAEREALTTDLMAGMNPLTRRIFAPALRLAQGWVALRERTKSIWVRAARTTDPFMAEAQRRFVASDLITEADDFFFLSFTEVEDVLAGRGATDYRPAVTRRRREYERNRHIELPERFNGHPVPMKPDTRAESGAVMTGTGVSPGRITARARVIRDPATDEPLLPGEVLVAPVTDAGWTPLFALAVGLVVDMGSALSHGSTVAREYGLPAVVNVRGATTRIKSGDLVAIDGAAGTVTILETSTDGSEG